MRLIVAVVGKPKHESIGAAIRDYEDRARRYWPLQVHEVKDEPHGAMLLPRGSPFDRAPQDLPAATAIRGRRRTRLDERVGRPEVLAPSHDDPQLVGASEK